MKFDYHPTHYAPRPDTHQADDDDDESDPDTSSVDSTEENEFHNTSEGPVMIRRSPQWHGAPALTHLLQTHSGADLMAGLDALAAKNTNTPSPTESDGVNSATLS